MDGLSEDRAEWARALKLCEIVERERPYSGPGLDEVGAGVFMVTGGSRSKSYDEFHEKLYSLGIVSPENHPGSGFPIEEDVDVDGLSANALARLITGICRGDRFTDGLMTHHINTGLLTNAFRRLCDLHLIEISRLE